MTATLTPAQRRARDRADASPGGRLDQALAGNPPPAELAYLTDTIGARATHALIDHLGGTRIHIPKSVSRTSRLAQVVGVDAAQALSAWRGGEDLKVPLARHWRIRVRRAMGDSYAEIALRLRITEKAVHDNLHAARLTRSQPDLFG